ncbi:hypothetical protein UFOVP1608_16 [uncultured Caudovirales phage]|uniref:Uncharacterized protein n=1 Tax=uncultured Caudovirales phage TaxID=2100421 RepID=A0A6J5SRT3_9CAUD|nr:hypothetical protein UFOVP1608_16 [uncultured Caudovirales phage]
MATTTKGFPYPANTDPVNIPTDMGALAEAIDDYIGRVEVLIVTGAM